MNTYATVAEIITAARKINPDPAAPIRYVVLPNGRLALRSEA